MSDLPGGIGVSLLRVYESGSPHVHLACAEGYYVIDGKGSVQTLSGSGFTETPLEQGALVWFDPGTIHRLVNDGDLQILTLMSNGGLPEAGDAVMTFPPEHLTDPATYAAAATLEGSGDKRTASAMRRRDLALDGFTELKTAYDADGAVALEPFYTAAVALIRSRLPDWRRRWQAGARRQSERTGAALYALEAGTANHLWSAKVHRMDAPSEPGRHGMCGRLDVYEHHAD